MKKDIVIKLFIIFIFVVFGYWTISNQAEAPVLDNAPVDVVVSIEDEIIDLFANQHNKDISEITIKLHNKSDSYLRGTVIFDPGGSENTGLFLASRIGNSWDIVFEGQGEPDCSAIMSYNFPRAFLIGICDTIHPISPLPSQIITSPLEIKGEARGTWFFEGSFPIVLTNWDGLIIAEGFATAEGDWMTDDYVNFTGSLEFENPFIEGDPAFSEATADTVQEFMKYGSLILQKDNPSGLPELDDALEIPIRFVE